MSIDPLAMDYTYNSPYAFQENKMGLGRELEGLELHYSTASEIVNNTGFRPLVNAAKAGVSAFASMFSPSAPQKLEKTSNANMSASVISENGGNENPKTVGRIDEIINGDPLIAAGEFALAGTEKATGSKNGMTDATKSSPNVGKVELFKEGLDAVDSNGEAAEAVAKDLPKNTPSGGYKIQQTYATGATVTDPAYKSGSAAAQKADSTAAASNGQKTEVIRQ